MGVVGFVGLPGTGKTLELVKRGLQARKEGRDVYANFLLGHREWGALVAGEDGRPIFAPRPALRDAKLRRELVKQGVRVGRGFIPDPEARVLRSWDELIDLRVMRDPLGAAHRDGCDVLTCNGCSRGITVLIDELNLWAPSRLWQEIGLGVLNRWAYVRKDSLDIIWTAQHEARIDKVAREVTTEIWTCQNYGPWRLPLIGTRVLFFTRKRWVPALLTEKNRTGAQEGAQSAGIMDFEVSLYDQTVADAFDTYEHVVSERALSDASRASSSRRRAAS